MLERLVETFCAVDDFCKAFLPQWKAYLIRHGSAPRGPAPRPCGQRNHDDFAGAAWLAVQISEKFL